jgi:hypothetical protein
MRCEGVTCIEQQNVLSMCKHNLAGSQSLLCTRTPSSIEKS